MSRSAKRDAQGAMPRRWTYRSMKYGARRADRVRRNAYRVSR